MSPIHVTLLLLATATIFIFCWYRWKTHDRRSRYTGRQPSPSSAQQEKAEVDASKEDSIEPQEWQSSEKLAGPEPSEIPALKHTPTDVDSDRTVERDAVDSVRSDKNLHSPERDTGALAERQPEELGIGDSSRKEDARGEDSLKGKVPPTIAEAHSKPEVPEGTTPLNDSPCAEVKNLSRGADHVLNTGLDKEGSTTEATSVKVPAKEAEVAEHDTPIETRGQEQREPRKQPPKYKGLARRPPKQQDSYKSDTHGPSYQHGQPLPIDVRLLFEQGGSCTVSLIAKRTSTLPETLTVLTPAGSQELSALQDDWYQDIRPPDIGNVLREGTEWYQEADKNSRWLLSGRELYVLAARSDLRGYISQTCLELGREHVVLCNERLSNQVEEVIRATGADPTKVLDASFGVPSGWIVFRDVIPKLALAPSDDLDILNALRPLPQIDISLDGGIRLEYTTWLKGYPPSIRVYGDVEHTGEVLIDGQPAGCGEDGTYSVNGWDDVGAHTIWCGGSTKSYTIVPFAGSWELWDAYTFPLRYGTDRRLGICGPLVHEVSEDRSVRTSLLVPEANSVVIGSVPGQCRVATRCATIPGAPCIVFPPFAPIWALPLDPLHCDKQITPILLIGKPTPPQASEQRQRQVFHRGSTEVESWCRLILDASRKGLSTKPDTEAVWKLWTEYKLLARRIWRSLK